MQRFKQILATGQLCKIFCVGRLMHPAVFDVHAMVGGFHGFWIDSEHAGVTYEQVCMASVAGRAWDLDCFVRMATTNYSNVTQFLEAGAGGVMAARVDKASEAEEFVQWCKFWPRGRRGLNTSGFDADYGGKTLAELAEANNKNSFVAIQIETLGALAECDQIAAIADVDLLFVGPADLSQEMGIIGQWDHPRIWDAYREVVAAAKRHGKHVGTICPNPDFARKAYDAGVRMLSFGMDIMMLRKGVEATKEAYRDLFAL